MSALWARLVARASQPVDGASLAALRILFGLLLCAAALRYFAHGWIEQLFDGPRFFFSYEGFEWVRPFAHPFMHVHFAVMALLGLAIAAGAFTRAAFVLYGLLFTYAHLIDKTTYLNHSYLVSLLCVLGAALPLHHVASVDAWRARRSGRPLPARVPAWAVFTLRAQLALVYVYAGVAKLHADWLCEALPLKIWLGARADLPLVGGLLAQEWAAYALSWASALFDLTVPLWLSWRRARAAAFAVLLVFHTFTGILFPIGIFPWLMTLGALVFFPPDWPRRLLRRPPLAPPPAESETPKRWPASRSLKIAAVWLIVQALVPARVLFGPPDLLWHEDGFRFGWRVMVMEKTGFVRFRVETRGGARRFEVIPSDYLTPMQALQMSTQPDLIVAFARFLAREHEARLGEPVAVYADAHASLNGRPAQRLIKPDVDLAARPHQPAIAYVAPRRSDAHQEAAIYRERGRLPQSP